MYLEEEDKIVQQTPQSAEEFTEAMKHVRENYVPKEKLEKAEADKAVLIKALSGEGPIPDSVQEKAKPANVKELRKEFLQAGETNMSNAKYVETALALRQAIIDEGGLDPFLPSGAKVNPTPQDIAGAQKTADALQSWLDAARDDNGRIDEELFNAFMRKGIAEDSPIITARLKAAKKAHA